MKNTRQIAGIALLLGAALLLAAALIFLRPQPAEPDIQITPEPTIDVVPVQPVPAGTPPAEESVPPEGTATDLPVGKLVITKERRGYTDGVLTLRIPTLAVQRSIYNGTEEAVLSKGVGLYDYAQLPGEGHRNVSLAGHRNGLKNGKVTDSAPFYYMDQLKDGDYFYLTDSTYIYRYRYESTDIVTPDDWSPIYVTEQSSLTITSCHPIGVSDHRIVVRAVLDETFDYTDDFDYLLAREDVDHENSFE